MYQAYNCLNLFQKLTSRYFKRISQLFWCGGRAAIKNERKFLSFALRGDPVNPYLSALRTVELVGEKTESQILVPGAGLEPARA